MSGATSTYHHNTHNGDLYAVTNGSVFLQAYERELPEAHEWFKIYIMTSDAILAACIWVSAV